MRSIKVLSLATLFALTTLFGSGLLASEADAAMTKDEAKCRSTIFKATSKYQAGAWKAVAGCHKGKLKGKVGAGVDCNDPIQADIKGKLGKAASKIRRRPLLQPQAEAVGPARRHRRLPRPQLRDG